jgi:prepilin-type N-terminal cleavage/methylation domain-containing protein
MKMIRRKKMNRTTENSTTDGSQAGYTLVEVIITMFILGMILVVINMVLISMIRVSYNTDIRIKMRQGVEFAFEVMRRNAKSTDPGTLREVNTALDEPALQLQLPGRGETVRFYRETDGVHDTGNGVLVASWSLESESHKVYLTSPFEIDVKSFDVEVSNSDIYGSTEVFIVIVADSANKRNSGDPLIKDQTTQTTIISRYRKL